MKILYVATAYAGLDSLLFDGAIKVDGLPPQTKVLRALVERGDEIDLVIHVDGKKRPLNIECEWLQRMHSIEIVSREYRLTRKLAFAHAMNALVKRKIREGEYDFVYLVGDACTRGAQLARRYEVPCGQRLFGSYATWMLERHSKLWCFVRHYPRMVPFYSSKDFLLMTEDGSDFEKTLDLLGMAKIRYDAYQWTNGVDFPSGTFAEPVSGAPDAYLFCGSRLERMKGQKTCIEVLRELDLRGYRYIHLVLAGRVSESGFDDELRKDAIDYGLDERVHLLGSIPQDQVGRWAVNALASLTFNPYSNRGNATIEALASGAVMIAPRADKWIDDLVIDGKTGFRVEGVRDAVDRIEWLLADASRSVAIRENARRNTRIVVQTWEERVQMELDLIDSYAHSEMKSLRSGFPMLRCANGD